jgi:Ca-activated chloride channel family protein
MNYYHCSILLQNACKVVRRYSILLLLLVAVQTFGQYSQKHAVENKTRILFLLDASQSMYGVWHGERKYQVARQILDEVLDSLKQKPNVQVALRVYGHLKPFPPQDCNDTRLEVPFGDGSFDRIKKALLDIKPKGTSPIAMALDRTENDFPPCSGCRNIVILITDGLEECGGDICEVSARLQQKNIFLKPYIIGMGQNMESSYDCAGTYFNAENKAEFARAINVVISKALNKTSLQVNLLDISGRPTETNVNMTFIDSKTGKVEENYIHTLNASGVPDTMVIDPEITWQILVNTLPPVTIDGVKLTKGQHNITSVSCPRGDLMVSLKNNTQSNVNPATLVYTAGSGELLNHQYTNQQVRYLQGTYDLEILTLPVSHLRDVKINAGETTRITLENPGILSIQKNIKGYGSLYRIDESGTQQWVIDLNSESAYGESFYLQPGAYRLVFRSRFSSQSLQSKTINFDINTLKTTRINL